MPAKRRNLSFAAACYFLFCRGYSLVKMTRSMLCTCLNSELIQPMGKAFRGPCLTQIAVPEKENYIKTRPSELP